MMTGSPNSNLVPFFDSSLESNMFLHNDHELVESSQSLECSDNFDGLLSNTEDPPRGLVFRPEGHQPNPRVPIPRQRTPPNRSNRARVSQACKSCQKLKTKCSGHRPACLRCEELGVGCNYSERKREKINKRLEDLGGKVEMLESLLHDVYPKLDAKSAQHVDQTLMKISSHDRARLTLPALTENCNAPEVPSVTIDYTEEDYNRRGELQASGFVGEHSETAWLYRLESILEQDSAVSSTSQDDLSRLSISINYYENDSEMEIRDKMNVLERPGQTEADELINTYFRIIHPSFPIIGKLTFLAQYRSFYADPTARPGKQWLAALNFIFAIGAMHLSPTQKIAEFDEYLHLVYFSRAWILSMENTCLRDHPTLQQVQVEGLAAFYLLARGQVNRSWKCCGIAIRSALAMGLNLRSESKIVAPLSKEIRYRMWWALFVLDFSLAVINGRPPEINQAFCTTPLPLPFEERDLHSELAQQYLDNNSARSRLIAKLLANTSRDVSRIGRTDDKPSGRPAPRKRSLHEDDITPHTLLEKLQTSDSLCFLYAATLTILMREAVDTLYAPGAAHRQWSEIEIEIASMNMKADTWLASLPAAYHFDTISEDEPLRHQSVRLAFQFYSTKLFITQPSLRQLIYNPPEPSEAFAAASGPITTVCIQAASQILDLLPDEPDLAWLYGVCPWWCALHYLMQPIAVILTESYLRCNFGTTDATGNSHKVSKAIAWLGELSKADISAGKAWLICSGIISRHGVRLGLAP